MRLSANNLHTYLMDRGLMSPASIVEGDYKVIQSHTRNLIFKAIRKNDKSFFVKQLVNFETANAYILQKDATCLWLIKNETLYRSLSNYVPLYHGFDPENQVLITECIKDARNLQEYNFPISSLSNHILDQIARILSSYHFEPGNDIRVSNSARFFPNQLPWVFNLILDKPISNQPNVRNPSGYNIIANAVNANHAFQSKLRKSRELWQNESLIHGDVKWMNFLITGEKDKENLKLIDWEIADFGDPMWDVAGVFQSFVCDHIYRTSTKYGLNPITLNSLNSTIIDISRFWNCYAKVRGINPNNQSLLSKALQFTSTRLIQTASESNGQVQQMQPVALQFLQTSFLILESMQSVTEQVLTINLEKSENG